MFFYVLNTNFERIAIIDSFSSAIWTDRAREAGDFQLDVFPTDENVEKCQQDRYIENIESEHLMVIESLKLNSGTTDGDILTLTGYSLEKILSRRIIWKDTQLFGSLQNGIKQLINDAIIAPEIAERRISNFVFADSTDQRITSLVVSKECKCGDNLYETITDLCDEYEINFKVVLDSNKRFVFSLYSGELRSYAQSANPYVVFSPDFENIISNEYSSTKEDYKNVCLVTLTKNTEEGQEPVILSAIAGSGEGIMRREIYADGSSVPEKNSHDVEYTDDERRAMMVQIGTKELGENKEDVTFEGEVDASGSFIYGRDFFLGDVVQIKNAYGMEGSALVKEIIWSQDSDGIKCYPTFEPQDPIEEGYLFYNGDQYRAITGGWTVYDPDSAKYNLEMGQVLKMEPSDENWGTKTAWIVTEKKIDLTAYKTLNAEIIGTGHIYISNSKSPWVDPVYDRYISIAEGNEYTIDLSSINGSYYVGFGPWARPHYTEAYKIWLTK